MILQIPVQGGHEGGGIKVEHLDQIRLFNVSENSDNSWHLTAFYADCDHQLEEVTFGWRLAMVFSLELETPKEPNFLPQLTNLQTFLDVSKVRSILMEWNQLKDGPKLFALPLEHRYSVLSELNFRGLKGNDRFLYQLIQSIDVVDFRLAQIQKYELGTIAIDENEEMMSDLEETDHCICCLAKNCECITSRANQLTSDEILKEEVKIVNFVDVAGDVAKSPGIILNAVCDVIPYDRRLFTKPKKKRMDYTENIDNPLLLSCWYDRPALVLWPKSKVLDVALSYNFNAELTRLEANPDVGIFGKVIDFCRKHPDLVWTETAGREDRTRRLIQLCLDLKSASEGLRLLEAIAFEFMSMMEDATTLMDYEGIRSKEVAVGVANLVALVGWKDCIKVIDKLTAVDGAMDQIENFAHLTIALLDLGLVESSKNLGMKVYSLLSTNKSMGRLPSSALVASFSMILRMYEIAGFTTIQLKNFTDSLKSLSFTQLFTVIADTDIAFSQVSEKHDFCQNLQRSLRSHVTTCFIPDDLAANVMIFFLQLDDSILLKEFVNRIVKQKVALAVSKILASPDVWNIALRSLDGTWALRFLVDHRICFLEQIPKPVFSWSQHCLAPLSAEVISFFRSNSKKETFFGFKTELAASDWISEFFGRDQVENGYSAKVSIGRGGDGEVCCVLTKTTDFFRHRMDKFLKLSKELTALRDRRHRRLGENIQSPSRRSED